MERGFGVFLVILLIGESSALWNDLEHLGLEDFKDMIPESFYNGNYIDEILNTLSSLRIGPHLGISPKDLNIDIDTGKIFDNDFVSTIVDEFSDTFDFTLDKVTGLFNGDLSSIVDFIKSPIDKFNKVLGIETECSGPGVIQGERVPDSCVGPSYSFVIDGGVCIIEDYSGKVVCSPPSVSLVKIPAKCSLQFVESTTVLGRSCIERKTFGEEETKTLSSEAKEISFESDDAFQLLGLKDLPISPEIFFDFFGKKFDI